MKYDFGPLMEWYWQGKSKGLKLEPHCPPQIPQIEPGILWADSGFTAWVEQ
jgi:hypothetical protein